MIDVMIVDRHDVGPSAKQTTATQSGVEGRFSAIVTRINPISLQL